MNRVTMDPVELDEVAELMQHLHHRHRVIGTKLQALRPGLQLETRVAADSAASLRLRQLLDRAEQALLPVAQASLADAQSVRRTAALARAAGDGPERRLSLAEAARLVDRVTGKTPEELAALEAGLAGGIGRTEDRYTAPEPGRASTDRAPRTG